MANRSDEGDENGPTSPDPQLFGGDENGDENNGANRDSQNDGNELTSPSSDGQKDLTETTCEVDQEGEELDGNDGSQEG